MSDIERIEKILLAMNSGDKIPEMNPSEFGPEFQRIVREINTLNEGFGGVDECIEILSAMTFNDYTRKVTGDYSGASKILAENYKYSPGQANHTPACG